jgi:hypothetical protein
VREIAADLFMAMGQTITSQQLAHTPKKGRPDLVLSRRAGRRLLSGIAALEWYNPHRFRNLAFSM